MEFFGMVVDRRRTTPAPCNIDVVTELSRPITVKDVLVFLGMTDFLRHLKPNYNIRAGAAAAAAAVGGGGVGDNNRNLTVVLVGNGLPATALFANGSTAI